MWPGFKKLNEAFFEFEEWAQTMTFYVTDGIEPGIYDRSDVGLLEWLVDPEADEDYFPDSEIPVQRYKNDDGDECFLLYTPVELERPQRMIMQINFN